MRVYGLKNCDTCRKAMKALDGAELVDVRAAPLSDAELTRFLETFGMRLLNTRSTTWRGLSEAERAEAPEALLRAHPALMKRPVIEAEGVLYLGWDDKVKSALL